MKAKIIILFELSKFKNMFYNILSLIDIVNKKSLYLSLLTM